MDVNAVVVLNTPYVVLKEYATFFIHSFVLIDLALPNQSTRKSE